MRQVINIAHRGASGYLPENTIEAFLKAVKLGADMVEMDIHQTKKGSLIVTHDYPIKKTALVNKPSLKDVIAALARKKIRLNIEIKHGYRRYPHIEEKVLTLLKKAGILRRSFISSFELYCVERLRLLNKDVSLGIIFKDTNYKQALKKAVSLNIDVLVTNKEFVSPSKVSEVHRVGLKLYAYTVNKISLMQRLISMSIDGIYTDYPDRLKKLLRRRMQSA